MQEFHILFADGGTVFEDAYSAYEALEIASLYRFKNYGDNVAIIGVIASYASPYRSV